MVKGEHILIREQIIPRSRREVFSFFAAAENLEQITPPALTFEISTPLPIEMAEDTLIDYKLRLMGIRFRWKTRITRWEPGRCFVDEQIEGPYARWVHTHTFAEVDGGTLVRDHVSYRLPLYPFGEVAYPIVRLQLRYIFDYRARHLRNAFT